MRTLLLIISLALDACAEAETPTSSPPDEPGGAAIPTQFVLGQEIALPDHLADGDELGLAPMELVAHGLRVFTAIWTSQEGGGRPHTTGTGEPIHDPSSPLAFPRNFNRVSAPDSNGCVACHIRPLVGGAGDFVASAFILGQRFDFATFNQTDNILLRGSLDESGNPVTLQSISNRRLPPSLFGAGHIEMLARQMTADLQALRDAIAPGESGALVTKGVSFGTLGRDGAGNWITSAVEGLPPPSLATTDPGDPPDLIIRPFHQAGAAISLRQFSNGAMNHHHGIQTAERFGYGTDPDGDGYTDELSRADVTALAIFQAQLAPPGRVIPRDKVIEEAVLAGEELFEEIGCASCHIPSLPLDDSGWIFVEPNPYNPPGNLGPGEAPEVAIDLTDRQLGGSRLQPRGGVVEVPAYTDLKLHDITSGPEDPNREPLDMHHPVGSVGFYAGNSRFLTKKLWGVGNTPPFFHHGQFTTLRQAILAHAGEAQAVTDAFNALSEPEKNAVIEFLKTLQVLPAHTRARVVDERGRPRSWPPR